MSMSNDKMNTNTTPALADHDGDIPVRLVLRPAEAARALGISERKLWSITADKTSGIPHVRFGRVVAYPVQQLAEWLAQKAAGGNQ